MGVFFHVVNYYTAMKRKAVCPTPGRMDFRLLSSAEDAQGVWPALLGPYLVIGTDKFTHRKGNSGCWAEVGAGQRWVLGGGRRGVNVSQG